MFCEWPLNLMLSFPRTFDDRHFNLLLLFTYNKNNHNCVIKQDEFVTKIFSII